MSDSITTPPAVFHEACKTVGFEIPESEIQQLGRYLDLLLETNKQFNLTAITDPDEAWMRHILDSLSLLPHLGEAKTVIDIGSGGGLPGIPLAIARPDLRVTLLEATGKKAGFLRQAIADLRLDHVQVVNDRAERVGQQSKYRQKFDRVIARAVGPLNVMLEYTMPLAAVGGSVLAMKGRKAAEELEQAGDAIMILGGGQIHVYQAMPGVWEDAVIVEIEKAQSTPRAYPRLPGVPKQSPL